MIFDENLAFQQDRTKRRSRNFDRREFSIPEALKLYVSRINTISERHTARRVMHGGFAFAHWVFRKSLTTTTFWGVAACLRVWSMPSMQLDG
jgi:hypothetical protein